MRGIIISILIFSSVTLFSQDWGIGLRLGDPTGFTIKKYMGDKAVEINMGRTRLLSRSSLFYKRIDWILSNKYDYTAFNYNTYDLNQPVGIQLHYLFHNKITDFESEGVTGLSWYFGIGGQFRFQTYLVDYWYKVENDPNWYYEDNALMTDFDIGADGVLGFEYTFDEVPISLFLDFTFFMEAFDNPFFIYFQGGLGGRINL